MDTVRVRLRQLIERYWRLPAPEGRDLLHVLCKSDCSRVKVLRHHLSVLDVVVPTAHGLQEMDAQHLFAEVLTPHFVIALLDDLRVTGALSVRQTRVIERSILACVDRDGHWRSVD